MVIGINVLQHDLERLLVKVQLTGLSAGSAYDVYRLQLRYPGKDDAGVRLYERELPDRRGLWSTVAHRIGWDSPATTVEFRDFEALKRPFSYFVCPSSVGGPQTWDFEDGPYPLSRGVLDDQVIHFNAQLEDAALGETPDVGEVLIRSTANLARYVEVCVSELDGPRFTARGEEHAVIGSQFPVFIADTREARRGSFVLLVRDLNQYNQLRSICFPESGKIWPITVHSSGNPTLLLDDLRCVPLDVEIEQAVKGNIDYRWVHLDFLEVDPNVPLVRRSGDNDYLDTGTPDANFTISDDTPAAGQWITVTDTSTGTGIDDYEWTLTPHPASNPNGVFHTEGPHKLRYSSPGRRWIKLRVGSKDHGYDTITKTVQVHA
jgi:hypothetical protein